MVEHYYSKNPQAESRRRIVTTTLRDFPMSFLTDSGVFSKHDIDFGSKLLIESFNEPEIPGDILDMGCGYGPIGIALSKSFPERQIKMVDINERAIALTKENIKNNGVSAGAWQSDLFEKVTGTFAAIVTNPPIRAGKKVVHGILSESAHFLAENGELWVVIQKKQGAPSALDYLRSIYGEVETVAKKKGYYVFRAKNI